MPLENYELGSTETDSGVHVDVKKFPHQSDYNIIHCCIGQTMQRSHEAKIFEPPTRLLAEKKNFHMNITPVKVLFLPTEASELIHDPIFYCQDTLNFLFKRHNT